MMTITLLDARRALYNKCRELFADRGIAESIYRYLCDGIEEESEDIETTLYGYNIEHLKLIADVLQKENVPPYIVAEALRADNRLGKIAELVEGTIDHFDRDDAMDLLYRIKKVINEKT